MKLLYFMVRLATHRFFTLTLVVTIVVSIVAASCSAKGTTTQTTDNPTTSAAVAITSSAKTNTSTTETIAATKSTTAGITSTAVTTTAAITTPSTTTTTQTTTITTTTTPAAPYSITILKNGQTIATLTLADLQKLTQVTSAGETGPTLLSVLTSVGVTDFTQLTINGFTQGHTAPATTTLTKAQVTNNVMLALVTRGTAKLTGSDVTTQIIDVNQIVVQ